MVVSGGSITILKEKSVGIAVADGKGVGGHATVGSPIAANVALTFFTCSSALSVGFGPHAVAMITISKEVSNSFLRLIMSPLFYL